MFKFSFDDIQRRNVMRGNLAVSAAVPGATRFHDSAVRAAPHPVARRRLDELTRRRVVRAFLANPQLSNVPLEVVETLVEAGYEKTWLHGELLLQFAEPCSEILVILGGAIEASWVSPSGARLIGEYIPPNEVINIIPALDGKGSLIDMRAHGTTTVFHVPREVMLNLLEHSPALLRGFFGLICLRAREQYNRTRVSSFADFRSKLARRLLKLAELYGKPVEGGVEIGLKLSQDDLASLIGVSRQSINKELRNFSDHGWIGMRYSQLTIFDHDALNLLCAASE
jgi:CRP/FNR family transcriptional regulator, cyclic AMP receptor protein